MRVNGKRAASAGTVSGNSYGGVNAGSGSSPTASIGGSLACKAMGKDHAALFVGQWVAPFLLLGIYNKMVKQHGSDASMKGLR